MAKLKFSTRFDRHESKGYSSDLPTRTQQNMKNDCDINLILKKYKTTGFLPDLIKQNPQYGDFSNVGDYQTALNTVMLAQTQFENLSAHVRERFANDPALFLAFCNNPQNADEMVKLGLATAKKPISDDIKPIPQVTEESKKGVSNG